MTISSTLIERGVRMESVFDTDPADLWSALTQPDRLARWIAEVEGDLVVGGELEAAFTSEWSGPCRVEVCDPPTRLTVTLGPGLDDETVIDAVLTPEGSSTRLVITERGLPTEDRPYHAAGWEVHLQDLATELAGGVCEPWKPRWQALLPAHGIG